MRTLFVVAGVLLGIACLTGTAWAEGKTVGQTTSWDREGLKKFCGSMGGSFSVEHDGKYSCTMTSRDSAINCEKTRKCTLVCLSRCDGVKVTKRDDRKMSGATAKGGPASSANFPSTGNTGLGAPGAKGGGRSAVGVTSIGPVATPSRTATPAGGGALGGSTAGTMPGLAGGQRPVSGKAGGAAGLSGSAGSPAMIGSSTSRKRQ